MPDIDIKFGGGPQDTVRSGRVAQLEKEVRELKAQVAEGLEKTQEVVAKVAELDSKVKAEKETDVKSTKESQI